MKKDTKKTREQIISEIKKAEPRCLGAHIGAGVYGYQGVYYHTGTGKFIIMDKEDRSHSHDER